MQNSISNITNNEIVEEKQDVKNNEIKSNIQKNEVNQLITFDGSKSVNSGEKDYTLSCQGNAGILTTYKQK